jgi:hypothetical protein
LVGILLDQLSRAQGRALAGDDHLAIGFGRFLGVGGVLRHGRRGQSEGAQGDDRRPDQQPSTARMIQW